MIDDAMLADFHAIALKIAPELASAGLVFLRHVDGWPLPRGCAAYAIQGPHILLRDELIRRGEWNERWPVVVVFVFQLFNEHEAMLIILLHEIAHLLPAKPAVAASGDEPTREDRARQANYLAEWAEAASSPALPWDEHGEEFIRVALHLHFRACRLLGRDIPLDGLCAGYIGYRLSHPAVYRQELGDEPDRMIGARFDEILATAPPEGFTELFESDTGIYFQRHPELRIAACLEF